MEIIYKEKIEKIIAGYKGLNNRKYYNIEECYEADCKFLIKNKLMKKIDDIGDYNYLIYSDTSKKAEILSSFVGQFVTPKTFYLLKIIRIYVDCLPEYEMIELEKIIENKKLELNEFNNLKYLFN